MMAKYEGVFVPSGDYALFLTQRALYLLLNLTELKLFAKNIRLKPC